MKFRTVCSAILLSISLLASSFSALAANNLQDVRVWPSPDKFRVVFDLTQQPDFTYFSLTGKDRLVIDFKGTKISANLKKLIIKSKLVGKIRVSKAPKKGMLRIVIDLNKAIEPRIFSLSPAGPYGDRLVVDLPKLSLGDKAAKTVKLVKSVKDMQNKNRDIMIAVDAGHGGEDPGSIGASGRYEKNVTLIIAKMLAARINKTKGLKAILTRRGDYYVDLNKRTGIARKNKTDLLVSIHADAFTSRKPHGASVLVLSSRRADTEVGRFLEDSEKHSQLLGGVGKIIESNETEKDLARTLIDMQMFHSMDESNIIAQGVLKRLGKVTHLHNKKPVYLSLGLLKSPDFPSIMVETGFISNRQDEKNLHSSKHRKKLVDAIFNGVNSYFEKNPPDGSLYAQRNEQAKPKTHRVVSGDSLSVLAKRYNTSVSKLKKKNALRSSMLRIGQVINI
ncbi:MAG: N-acetylmuramoyl-L-alanine amidase [Psychrobium sp.]|nr:N-acetylmuramoyl-L-alanine amidase [Psychrobium sp.]